MNWEHSCGAVVFTRLDGEPRFVLVQQKMGHFGFPKGHMEPGETEEQTALREISEEVGLRPDLISGFREEITYTLPAKPDTKKRVTIFLAEYRDQKIVPQEIELRQAVLVPYEKAMETLHCRDARRILQAAMEYLNHYEKGTSFGGCI